MKDFSEAMFWLDESRVVNFCYNTTEPSVGLALSKDDSKLKLYMADTGLLVSMAFGTGELEYGGIYEKILRGKLIARFQLQNLGVCQLYRINVLCKIRLVIIPEYQLAGITGELFIQPVYNLF